MDGLIRGCFRLAYKGALCYWFVFRPSARGAYVAVWCNRRLLVIRNSYKDMLTIPCGGVRRGETARQAAVRELREEVGIELAAEQLTRVDTFTSYQEYKTDRSDVFEVTLVAEPDIEVDRREVDSAEFMSIETVRQSPLAEIVRQYLDQRHAGADGVQSGSTMS